MPSQRDSLLSRLSSLTALEMRSLNRYHLHPEDRRCCSACLTIYEGIRKHFHIKKYDQNGRIVWNIKCSKCFNKANRERTKSYRKDPQQFIRSKFAAYRGRAKIINCPFDLTPEYLIELWNKQQGACYYTERAIDFTLVTESGKCPHPWTPSLDRLDPAKGYTQGNVVWCSYAINRMKNEFTYDEFIHMCSHILTTRGI